MQDILSFTRHYFISDGSGVKNLLANAGDMGLIPGLERSPREGNGSPFQFSCMGNPMNRGTWWAVIHGVIKELDMTSQLNNNNFIYIIYLIRHIFRLLFESKIKTIIETLTSNFYKQLCMMGTYFK